MTAAVLRRAAGIPAMKRGLQDGDGRHPRRTRLAESPAGGAVQVPMVQVGRDGADRSQMVWMMSECISRVKMR